MSGVIGEEKSTPHVVEVRQSSEVPGAVSVILNGSSYRAMRHITPERARYCVEELAATFRHMRQPCRVLPWAEGVRA